jgi:2-amino-4-hydroxy-6-hydroxymethyldihydropteridine diphosphokinase
VSLRAVVGLGANLGDRLATMRSAVVELGRAARVLATSSVYATAPVGPVQPEFLNAAALVSFDGTIEHLLDEILAIERRLGRVRAERWGPRTIDLDLLWAGETVTDTDRLVVPHPRLHERAFALVPLLELVPDARDPRTGERYVVPPGAVRRMTETI